MRGQRDGYKGREETGLMIRQTTVAHAGDVHVSCFGRDVGETSTKKPKRGAFVVGEPSRETDRRRKKRAEV